MRQFDYSSLERPVSLNDIWAELRKSRIALISYIFLVFIFGWVFILAVLADNILFIAVSIGFMSLVIGIFLLSVKQAVVLQRFIVQNNLAYVGPSYTTAMPGVIFNTGSKRHFTGGIADEAGGWLLANYEYQTGSGKNTQTHSFGVIRVALPRRLPHVVLDATKNNYFGSNLPAYFSAGQKLVLEGDFNKYFTVYVPQGYQRDALYFLTPELMAILIDSGKDYDFEIVDDNLFIYTNVFNFGKGGLQKTIEKYLQLSSYFCQQFSQNTKRYSDARVAGDGAENSVGTEGMRLKKTFAWKWYIVPAVFLLIWAYVFIAGIINAL